MKNTVLTADIGGTNARFGCAARGLDGAWDLQHFKKFQGDDYPAFKDVLAAYLDSLGEARPDNAIFSVAGPVADGKVSLTNRDWSLDAQTLCDTFGFQTAHIINDFAAMTRSVPELAADDLLPVKSGMRRDDAPILVAGPGTGFGVGYLLPTHSGWHVITTEGGHQAYAPQTDREMELLNVLQRRFDFVTLELVASGSGLHHVHRAVCERLGQKFSPLSPDIIREKAKRGDAVCLEVCETRAAATMSAIADLALSGGARGGVVLAGGVSERMIEFFKSKDAMSRFLKRGNRSDYLADIPIDLLINPKAALLGAAALYEDLATRSS